MNIHEIYEKRSLDLHKEIVNELRKNPLLWDKPLSNIDRWVKQRGKDCLPYMVWKEILTTLSHEAIIEILLSESEKSILLRSSTPFVGIISEETRKRIYAKWSKK